MSHTPSLNIDIWKSMGRSLPDQRQELRSSGFKGVLLIGPAKYGLDAHPTFPLMGFRVFSALESFGVDFDWSAMLVVVRLESQEVFAGRLCFVRDDYEYKVPSTKPSDALVASQFFVNDVSERLPEFTLRAGTYLSVVLLNDYASNRVRTQVSLGAVTERDPAVVEFLESHRRPEGAMAPIYPSQRMIVSQAGQGSELSPSYRVQKGSPPLPEELGIAMRVERVVVYEERTRCMLRGSFRLPVLRRNIVPRAASGGAASSPVPAVDVGDSKATAVVPISLVIVGNLYPGPTITHLRVPSYDAIDANAKEGVVTGYFDIDLFALDEMQHLPQTYHIWAFSGEHMAGPTLMAIVTPDMLPEN